MERHEGAWAQENDEEVGADRFREIDEDELRYLQERITTYRKETIPRKERSPFVIQNSAGVPVATIEKTHDWDNRIREEWRDATESEMGYVGEKNLWVVVDFDDVLNRTTEYQEYLKSQLSKFGLPPEDFDDLYRETKKIGAGGKNEFDYFAFIEKIKARLPDKQKKIESFLQKLDYKKFVDQSLVRALEVIQADLQPVKVSLLTFGDPAYQKMRIDATNADQIVDEIIYTEGSKKEVLEVMKKGDYDPNNDADDDRVKFEDNMFVITIDDSPEHLEDYEKLSIERQYANIRYRHPGAKRYDAKTQGQEVIEANESSPHQAALNVYRAAKIGQRLSNFWVAWEGKKVHKDLPDFDDSRTNTRAHVYSALKDPEKYPDIIAKMDEIVSPENEAYIENAIPDLESE